MSARIFPVLLAGGASSRLWPASDREKPKWDLRLFSKADSTGRVQSLLEGAWERGRAVAPASDCFVVAGAAQAPLIRQSLPELTAENLLIEPEPRDTAAAVAYAAAALVRKINAEKGGDSRGVMLVLPGDHVIHQVERFAETTRTGAEAALELDALVTYGIVPQKPATGYGYIHRGDAAKLKAANASGPAVYRVSEFREKPDRATAEKYVSSGEYFWNGGIFLYPLHILVSEFERQLPGHGELIKKLSQLSPGGSDWESAARQLFPALKKISIDFGIMEHARAVATVAASFDWDDIGSWSAVAAHLQQGADNATGPATTVLPVDARNNLVFAPGKRVALIGVEGLAVVESGSEILICKLDRDQDVKKVSELVRDLNKPR
ncbi:MAG TPA: mannose-1-phosphate guanylyltransferase [Planctomycetota bacterium]|nr:mannose-1-phosphate guanylyltransferase [Planctomycetota bacterium]